MEKREHASILKFKVNQNTSSGIACASDTATHPSSNTSRKTKEGERMSHVRSATQTRTAHAKKVFSFYITHCPYRVHALKAPCSALCVDINLDRPFFFLVFVKHGIVMNTMDPPCVAFFFHPQCGPFFGSLSCSLDSHGRSHPVPGGRTVKTAPCPHSPRPRVAHPR